MIPMLQTPLRGLAGGLAAALVSAAAVSASSSTTSQPDPGAIWVWPVPGREIVREFEPPEERWSRGHRGVDLAAPEGTAVVAVDAGVVSHSGVINGVGTITVRHNPSLRSTYQPVEQRLPVGAAVAQGEQIGVVTGASHCPPRQCLHLGAIENRDTYLDPLLFLQPGEVSLLPLER